MPKISVIIPAYNCEKFLPTAIDSVLSQTYRDYEILIIDDGSADDTKNLATKYANKYPGIIKYMYQDNAGPAAARNKGIEASKGTYLSFLDTDDIWLPEKLELQIRVFDANPEVALVFTDSEVFEENRIIRESWSRSNFKQPEGSFKWKVLQKQFNDGTIIKGNLFNYFRLDNLVATSSAMISRECLNIIGDFDIRMRIAEDYDFWLRISEQFSVAFLNKVTFKYRLCEGSASGEKNLRLTKYSESNAIVYEKMVKRCPYLYNDTKRAIFSAYKSASWGYLNNMQLNKSRELALKSLEYYKLQPKLYLYILLSYFPKNIIRFIRKTKKILSYEKN